MIRTYAYAIAGVLFVSVIGYAAYLRYENSMQADTIALQQSALDIANNETEIANGNTQRVTDMYEKLTIETKIVRARLKAQARELSNTRAEITKILSNRPSIGSARDLTARLRSELERTQGHPFDGTAAEAYSAAPGTAAYCLDSRSTAAVIELATQCRQFIEEVGNDGP